MEFDLTKATKKAIQNVVDNTLYRGKPIKDWINFIANNADDLISRQVVIDVINEHLEFVTSELGNDSEVKKIYKMAYNHVIDAISILPAIQPKQKTGRWLINSDGYYPYCSICKNEPQGRIMTDYCPNCGAKMKK